MKYLLIILMFVFISCGEDEIKKVDQSSLCSSGYCQEQCPERKNLYDIYNKDKVLVRICLERCSVNYTFNQHEDPSNFCHLSFQESENKCTVNTMAGNWCEGGFLDINEE